MKKKSMPCTFFLPCNMTKVLKTFLSKILHKAFLYTYHGYSFFWYQRIHVIVGLHVFSWCFTIWLKKYWKLTTVLFIWNKSLYHVSWQYLKLHDKETVGSLLLADHFSMPSSSSNHVHCTFSGVELEVEQWSILPSFSSFCNLFLLKKKN